MSINYNEISSLISNWLKDTSDRQTLIADAEMVNKAINIAIYLLPKNTDGVFLQLCALNFLNAAIKTEAYKDQLSYDLIKSNAAKLVSVIDGIKTEGISYYYNKEEYCLYFELSGIVFSFHHVPLTSEILKASFASPISWPGIRLQKIARPLLNYVISSLEDDIEIKTIIEKVGTLGIIENKTGNEALNLLTYEDKAKSINKNDVTSPNEKSNGSIIISNEVRVNVAKQILSIISEYCTPDSEGWFDLVNIAPKLKANGVDYSLYGFQKLASFLEAVFGDSMQRKNVGSTMVFLKFPLDYTDTLTAIDDISNDAETNQDAIGILSGVRIGDDVEISTYGISKSGKISILNKQFVQLELKDKKSVRIRCDAISSIESKFSSANTTPIDLSFANAVLKDIMVAEGLYSSSTIDTNATITIVESRRIWLTTDDGNTGSCYKGSIIGYDKEKLVKGQRVFVFPFKKEKIYCVIMEMSYDKLYEILEHLLSSQYKPTDYKRGQILSLLTFITKKINQTESLQKIKGLKRQVKSILSSSDSSTNNIEDAIYEEETAIEDSIHEIPNDEMTSAEGTDTNPSYNDNVHAKSSDTSLSEDVFKPELTSTLIQGPKVIGKIDLKEIGKPRKKKEREVNDAGIINPHDSISIDNNDDLLPSMGKIKKMWADYGYIKPYNQEKDLYFYTSELVSYAGIIESPSVGDEVVFSLGQNSQGPIALCIHKQCTKDIVEDLVEKLRYDTKTCSRLKKHIEDFDKLNADTSDNSIGLAYYFEKVGINPRTSFSPNDVEKLFAEKLPSNEYVIAIELLIDEVVKKDPSKCYNLFLRSSSYAKSHKMYGVSRHLIEKALELFKGEPGKVRYFKGLYKSVESLNNRIEINEKTLANSLEISGHVFPFMPVYVRDLILSHKDFNGIKLDKETIRTGLYKEEYIEELKESIKQNNADDLLYLTLIKLQLAFHPQEYNPKDDVARFLVNRAKNILATGKESRYNDARYFLRLAYRLKSFKNRFDDTVGLYLMTLGEYTASDLDIYMRGSQNDYKFEDLLKNVLANGIDATLELELALLTETNSDIKNRIIREYERIGKNTDGFAEYSTIANEVKRRYAQYEANPAINFMSFISYLPTTAILLDNEMNVVNNDSVKIVSNNVTDFNTGQKYNAIRDAYNNIIQKIDAIIPNLIDHPTEIGYETILPALKLLKKDVRDKFKDLEKRVNPTIQVEILESVGIEETKVELKVEIRNSSDSARSVHINSLNVSGDDLAENNNITFDVTLHAGEEKLINVELPLRDNTAKGKIAEVKFEIEYDDIYIATEQRIPRSSKIYKTINFENKPFVEIENKFRQCSGGEELEAGDKMFFGRNKLISDIQEAIFKGTKNQIAIFGQKRSGKSSLLNQIKGKLESDESHSVICGKFSLQGLPANELNPVRWILESIVISLLQGIRKHGIKKLESILASLSIDIKIAKNKIYDSIIAKFFSEDSDDFKSLGSFVDFINTLEDFQNSHFVIFIDEFTYLYQLIKEKKVNDDFMRRWIALIETPGMNLQAIVAAQDTLPHFMDESYASNYFNKFRREPLSYLSKEEALQLIKDPIKDVIFHNHSDERIYDYTSGSAFFTQIFCTRLVDYLNSEKSNVVGREEIEIVAERLCTGTQRLEKSTFECLTKEADGSDFNEADNIRVLKAIAEHTRAGGHVNMEDLNVDFPPEKLRNVLDNLSDRRVISRQDKGYSINVKLFVKWILNN